MPKHSYENSKRTAIQQNLRMRIASGACAPASRFPTHRELSREFGISPVTLQAATATLEREGFLAARGRHGTFVAHHPPCNARYALAFPSRDDGVKYWTDHWTILGDAARATGHSRPEKRFEFYYDIAGHEDVEDYRRLMADARARRIAGIILLAAPYSLIDSALLHDCPVPRVYIGGNVREQWGIPSVVSDGKSFLTRAIGLIAAAGRRRPALIAWEFNLEAQWSTWSGAARRHGMRPDPSHMLAAPFEPREAVRHLAQVLMQLPRSRRPDALVATDDHHVEEITRGVRASGLPQNQWPVIVALTNFPKRPPTHVPVTFLGYDSRAVIGNAVELIDAQHRGGELPATRIVSPILESELSRETFPSKTTSRKETLHPQLERNRS